jgi:hypothetical protein
VSNVKLLDGAGVAQFVSRIDCFPNSRHHAAGAPMARTDCTVCAMEDRWGKHSKTATHACLARCVHCGVHAHCRIPLPEQQRKIHALDQFRMMTCFETMHTHEDFYMWQRAGEGETMSIKCNNKHEIAVAPHSLCPARSMKPHSLSNPKNVVQFPEFRCDEISSDDTWGGGTDGTLQIQSMTNILTKHWSHVYS